MNHSKQAPIRLPDYLRKKWISFITCNPITEGANVLEQHTLVHIYLDSLVGWSTMIRKTTTISNGIAWNGRKICFRCSIYVGAEFDVWASSYNYMSYECFPVWLNPLIFLRPARKSQRMCEQWLTLLMKKRTMAIFRYYLSCEREMYIAHANQDHGWSKHL